MHKIITVIGARPQFVKASAVSRCFAGLSNVKEVLVNTGQHYDTNMSDTFFSQLGVPSPKYTLSVGSGSHAEQTAASIVGIEKAIIEEMPNAVIVYGDTNATIAGALAATKLCVPVVHVEAGLRSFNREMPEEINRIATDSISSLLLTPTDSATKQLIAEGVPNSRIECVGDVMLDVAIFSRKSAAKSTILSKLGLSEESYLLLTMHRAENIRDTRLLKILIGQLLRVAESEIIVFPIHPGTRKTLQESGLLQEVEQKMLVTEPLGYMEFTRLVMSAKQVITDSGGLQKEAYFHNKLCFTLRHETEWKELVNSKWNRLLPSDLTELHDEILARRPQPADHPSFYGEGKAAEKIVASVCQLIKASA